MKSTGIVRPIDPLGRLVIPAEIRKTMEWPEKTPMEIYTEGDSVIIKKYQPACIFCGSLDDVHEFKGKKVCGKCASEI
jgi:transcriptional pleiotropic regulator of transition state genes